MATLDLTREEYKALETTRLRLMQITSGIAGLKADVFASNPLPNLESLQNHADILESKIQSVVDITSSMAEVFSRVAVHPSTNFPGRTQEMILLQLLRKKPEPDVATTMDEGRKLYAGLITATDPSSGTAGGSGRGGVGGEILKSTGKGPEEELESIWDLTRGFCEQRIRDYVTNEADDMFTEEERERGIENVRTGLKRVFDDEEEDEDEEEEEGDDDVMEIDRPPPPPAPGIATQEVEGAPLENIMRFAARGEFVPH
ncbi:mediator of RNA polymerase II transcription complex subunit 8-domain-containing protein [Hypoxylon sp. FL0890]|nr:mediator of RNA polymerase II transcription complex subunit 8-domain-containing protein [Hypoxylon sp. FL0890]